MNNTNSLNDVTEELKQSRKENTQYEQETARHNTYMRKDTSTLIKLNLSGFNLMRTQLDRQIMLMSVFVKELTGINTIFQDSYDLDKQRFEEEKKNSFDALTTAKQKESTTPVVKSNEEVPKEDKKKGIFGKILSGIIGAVGMFATALMSPIKWVAKMLFNVPGMLGGAGAFFKNLIPNLIGFGKAFLKKIFIGFLAIDFITTMFNPEKVKEITGKKDANILEKIGAGVAAVIETVTFGLFGNSKDIYKFLKNDLFDTIVGLFKSIFMDVGGNSLVEEIKTSFFKTLKTMYTNIVMSIANIFGFSAKDVDSFLGPFIIQMIDSVKTCVVGIVNTFSTLFSDIANFFSSDSNVMGFGGVIKNFIFGILDTFANVFNGIFDYIKSLAGEDTLVGKVVGVIQDIFNGLISTIKFVIDKITGMFDGILSFLGLDSGKSKAIKEIKNGKVDTSAVDNMESSGKIKQNVIDYDGIDVVNSIDIVDFDKLTKPEAEQLIRTGKLDKKTEQALYDKFFVNDFVKKTQEENKKLDADNSKWYKEQNKKDGIITIQKPEEKELPKGQVNTDELQKQELEKQKSVQNTNINSGNTTIVNQNTNVGETINMAMQGFNRLADKFPNQ